MCRLLKALYGHLDAGTSWETYAADNFKVAGFVPINDWRSCFRHPRLDLMLIVYVDDIKLSGPIKSMTEGWTLLRKNIVTGDPEPVSRYLGREHPILDVMIPAGSNPAHGDIPEPTPKASKKQKEGVSDVQFLQSQQASQKARLKNDYQRAHAPTKQMVKAKVMVCDMKSCFKSCVITYLQLTKANISTL